jgi:hypothetical protein
MLDLLETALAQRQQLQAASAAGAGRTPASSLFGGAVAGTPPFAYTPGSDSRTGADRFGSGGGPGSGSEGAGAGAGGLLFASPGVAGVGVGGVDRAGPGTGPSSAAEALMARLRVSASATLARDGGTPLRFGDTSVGSLSWGSPVPLDSSSVGGASVVGAGAGAAADAGLGDGGGGGGVSGSAAASSTTVGGMMMGAHTAIEVSNSSLGTACCLCVYVLCECVCSWVNLHVYVSA